MANPVQALNDNFFYNSMLARALVPILPALNRSTIRMWLDKLHEMDKSPEEMTIRNDYMWFLLLMLQSQKVSEPFNYAPTHELQPLRTILSPKVYEEILSATDRNMSWLEHVNENVNQHPKQKHVSSHPAKFFENQPLPKNGIICYMSAFSDHDF